ncbi:MAG: Asp-tRNA(Asn)/Glu-tRNA(Gln) amidotransferase subunit GatB [Chloroflexota bacterium]
MEFVPVIGVEVHVELATRSKMFCSCPVVDATQAEPNSAVCPVCAGMPGVLPVVNRRAVEYAVRVALALECEIPGMSFFARKNYFYPDLPKGYQISQYEYPLGVNGRLPIFTSQGEQVARIRRVHLEEDTGKLTHVERQGETCSLVDLNRAGVPLLEIVSEPDMHTAEEVRAYAVALRNLLKYLGVNSGDLQKGVLRIEPNISVRPLGSPTLGTRVEVKNLNSFRALERSVDFEIGRQIEVIQRGGKVIQETLGWDEKREVTFTQRVKEEEDDYRYFPEPDLPPLVLEREWIEKIAATIPELPHAKHRRFLQQYALRPEDVDVLVSEQDVALFFEQVVASAQEVSPRMVANWVTGELFGLMNQHGVSITQVKISPQRLAGLLRMIEVGEINNPTGKAVLAEMFLTGKSASEIVESKGLRQIFQKEVMAQLVEQVLEEYPGEVATYLSGKEGVINWLFGKVMAATQGRANPQVVKEMLESRLSSLRKG